MTYTEPDEDSLVVDVSINVPLDFFGEHLTADEIQNLDYEQIEAGLLFVIMERVGKLTEDAQRLLLEGLLVEDWNPSTGYLAMYQDEHVEKFGSARTNPNSVEARSAIGEACSKCKKNPADAIVDGDPTCTTCLVEIVDAEYEVVDGEVTTTTVRLDDMCKVCGTTMRIAGYTVCTSCYLLGEGEATPTSCDHGIPYDARCTKCEQMDIEVYRAPDNRTNPQDSKYYCAHGTALAETCSQCNIENNGKSRTITKAKTQCVHGVNLDARCVKCPKQTAALSTTPAPVSNKPVAPLLEIGGVPIMRKRKVKA